MSKPFPDILYHSISQSRLQVAALQNDSLPGLSRFHFDPEGKNPGCWLSNDLPYLVTSGHGKEDTGEIVGKFILPGKEEPITVTRTQAPIFLQLESLEEERLLQHPMLQSQFFYTGDVAWAKIKRLLIPEGDSRLEEEARKIMQDLKRRFDIDIELERYDRISMIERAQSGRLENRNKLPFEKVSFGSEGKD